jgi:molybdate transport system substrate-binding protein
MRLLIRVVLSIAVLAGSVSLLAAASAARKATTVSVTLTDSAIRLSKQTAPVGDVTFAVKNTGKSSHNFRIAGKQTRMLTTNQTARLAVTFAKAGAFAYASTAKGDAAKGLKGTFRLTAAPAAIPDYDPITVLAAASLTDVFPAVSSKERYSFAGSNALATQIRNGAPGDVFASANTEIPALLFQQGFVEKPVNFTRNALVIVVPRSNPANIDDIYDLGNSGVRLVTCAVSVPVGAYTQQVLRQMNLTAKVNPNIVSQETDVRAALSKVALGQADAGFVYATDAQTVPNDVKVIKVPAWAQPKVVYAMAVISRSPNKAAAQAFVDRVLSASGQATMAKYGFLRLPNATATGTT